MDPRSVRHPYAVASPLLHHSAPNPPASSASSNSLLLLWALSMEEKPPPKDTKKVEEGGGGGGPSASASSPEFEFWRFRNFSFSETHLCPADQLFVDGVLLPLNPSAPQPLPTSCSDTCPELQPECELAPDPPAVVVSASKRWMDIFRLGGERKPAVGEEADEKKKKKQSPPQQHKERRGLGGAGPGAADLNINIWPFSRSQSSGNGAPRPKAAPTPRKVSSAPCSRSNSGGESKSAARRLAPASPARGVHVGRGSPVWHVRRRGPKGKDHAAAAARSTAGGSSRVRVLNLNVPMCMGYRQQMSCRSDSDGGGGGSGRTAAAAGVGNGNGGGLFTLKTLFSKKVY